MGIFSNQEKDADKSIKYAFSMIKEELDDYRESINENTSEIQSNYETVSNVERKIEKLAERIEQIELLLHESGLKKQRDDLPSSISLTLREQEIFFVLYTLGEKTELTYTDIARKLSLTDDIVRSYITTMIAKGVPVVKRYKSKNVFLVLDNDFRSLQAKKNVIVINDSIIESIR